MIWDVCAIDKAVGAWSKIVCFADIIVLGRIVDGEALLLQLIADKGGTLGR